MTKRKTLIVISGLAAVVGVSVFAQSRSGQWTVAPTLRPGVWSAGSSSQDPPDRGATERAHDPEARLVAFERASKLVDRLRPGDKALEVVKKAELPWGEGQFEDPGAELDYLTAQSAAALVVRVLDIQGRLTPEENWIESDVVVEVEEVLKDSTAYGLSVGSRFDFPIDGGEVHSSNQRLLARTSWEVLPKRGRTYLYFFVDYRGKLYPDIAIRTFELKAGRIARLSPERHGGLDKNVDADWARSQVRSAAIRKAGGGK